MDVDGWIEFARRDLEAARVLRSSANRLPVGFHCQQAIEKLLKALYVKQRAEVPPRTHDLARLAHALDDGDPRWKAESPFLAELSDLCVRARYAHPDWKSTIAYLDTEATADRLLLATQEIFVWLESKLV